MDEKLIQKYMKSLDLTREEAIELINEDNEVDGMTMKEVNADLTEEQKKVVKASTKTGKKKPTTYKFEKKERPKDEEKVELVEKIFENVKDFTENCEIFNAGKEITFNFNGNSYSISLIKHRNPKKN